MRERNYTPNKKRREGRKFVSGKGEEFTKDEANWDEFLKKPESFAARVVEVQKRYIFVAVEPNVGEIETKNIWLGTLPRKFLQAVREERNFVVVGDRVLCLKSDRKVGAEDPLPQCSIEFRAPRSSKISRLDPMHNEREHVLAANLTQMVIIASFLAPKIKWGLIDRFLVLAEEQEVKTLVILNKTDLLENSSEDFQEECKEMIALYRSLGYRIFLTQADSGHIDTELQKAFEGEISLVAGHSGVGKSSIVNLMEPEIIQDVETEEVLLKGRHTTTYASFLKLGTGGFVIDSPGIRSFLIKDYDPIELSWCFVDLRPYISKCKFRECRHLDEPGCAVQDAVKKGEISAWRYKSYIAILTGASGREGRVSIEF
jgi:ribosome biogenesis GTPase